MQRLAIIGGGPAGLRAAEVASAAGVAVTLYESKRSVGRKFLVAGKGGFNMTHTEGLTDFAARYQGPGMPADFWSKALQNFDNEMIREWATSLGVETFAASSGRVYPKALKAAPLLRAWLRRLRDQGVTFAVNHRLLEFTSGRSCELTFAHLNERIRVEADAVIFAMGGGSWPQTGSDGSWLPVFQSLGIGCHPLSAANCGWEVAWSPLFLEKHEGEALKNLVITAGGKQVRGELVITRYGLEGGPIYQLGPVLRAMPSPEIKIDFKPTLSTDRMEGKMESVRRHFSKEAQTRWKLSEATTDLIEQWHGPFSDAKSLAAAAKGCAVRLVGPRPIAEAISSAGGIRWTELDQELMLLKNPGLFAAGEMIDWEAPTGGYLMQGCFASGTLAGGAAAEWLSKRST